MKPVTTLLLLLPVLVSASLRAQPASPAKPAAAHASAAHPGTVAAAHPGCAKLPEMSPKIPAVSGGCAKTLYTITTVPPVVLSNIAPVENPAELREALGLEASSFSLLYIDTKVGTGALVAAHKWDSLLYTGYLVDGTKFDSSADHGNVPFAIQYGVRGAIRGWLTGLSGMHVGGKRRLFIPFQLAYGMNGSGPIPPHAELIFDVELVAQGDTDPTPPPPPPAPPTVSPAPGAGPSSGPPSSAPSSSGPPPSVQPGAAPPVSTPSTPRPAAPATDPTKPTVDPKSTVPPPIAKP